MKYWITTYTGVAFDFENPTPDMVNLTDIAVALSRICRYAGHCKRPFSVLEHVLYGVKYVSEQNKLEWLLHDAHEAYLGDVTSDMKKILGPPYKQLESAVDGVIRKKFNLLPWPPEEVKVVDLRMLATERQQLMHPNSEWEVLKRTFPFPNVVLWPLNQDEQIRMFLKLVERESQ